ncbi:MAG: hypothetical protein CMI16_11795 [Opitutaceae bacterium]|nr:hypothetical protein [Opitutaceae bacterium]
MLTVFARIRLLGLMAWRIIQAARDELPSLGIWCAAWVILMSACFRVVLERPMGALIFWIALRTTNSGDEIKIHVEETVSIEAEPLPNPSSSV